jgi:hypothetical protein
MLLMLYYFKKKSTYIFLLRVNFKYLSRDSKLSGPALTKSTPHKYEKTAIHQHNRRGGGRQKSLIQANIQHMGSSYIAADEDSKRRQRLGNQVTNVVLLILQTRICNQREDEKKAAGEDSKRRQWLRNEHNTIIEPATHQRRATAKNTQTKATNATSAQSHKKPPAYHIPRPN